MTCEPWDVVAPQPEARPIARFSIVLPVDQTFTRIGRHIVALSPDGTRLVYVANNRLFLRALDQATPVAIRGTEVDPTEPFFSPDGQWIGFWTNGQLKKTPTIGGRPSR